MFATVGMAMGDEEFRHGYSVVGDVSLFIMTGEENRCKRCTSLSWERQKYATIEEEMRNLVYMADDLLFRDG